MDCYYYLSLSLTKPRAIGNNKWRRIKIQPSVRNIWPLSYSVYNYRDLVKGHEVAGGIKSETQVMDV